MTITPSTLQFGAMKEISQWYHNGSNPFFYLGGYAGSGKAQPLTAKLQTPTGPMDMGDVMVGDTILGSQGTPTTVTAVYPQGVKPTYRITFMDGSSTECCDEHLWTVQTSSDGQNNKTHTIPLSEMIEQGVNFPCGIYRYYVPLCQPVQYQEQQLTIPPYIFGSSVDNHEKFIPEIYMHGSIDQRIELLRGLMDSGGVINHNRVSFVTDTKELHDGIRTLVQSLGGIVIQTYNTSDNNPKYHTNIKVQFNPFKLVPKADKWTPSWKNPPSRAITGIERITDVEQQCIMVDAEDHLYLTDEFIVTHNTSIAKLAVERCGLDPDNHRQVLYGSFTGKAAMVMKRKGLNADTIHHLIYELKEKKNGELYFGLNRYSPVRDIKLLVLDECSMISDIIAKDLLSFGTKILVLGDPAQLEPVHGTGYFTKGTPDFFLNEIHRQALDNAIIRLSMDVRNGKEIPFGDHGEVRKMRFEDISDEGLLDSDQVITGKHTTRHLLNMHMLEAEGFVQGYAMSAGMKVLCLRNYRDKCLLNGSIGRTTNNVESTGYDEDRRFFKQRVLIEDGLSDGQQITEIMRMNMGAFEDNWKPRTDNEIANDEFIVSEAFEHNFDNPEEVQYLWDYGYAITCHKSQGSQWPHVIVFDDGMLAWKRESRKRWLYTAVTRAEENLTILV